MVDNVEVSELIAGGEVLADSLLSAIVNSSDDAIYSKSCEAILTSWNPGAEALYGYTRAEAVGRPVSMIIPPHRSGEEMMILEQILRGERVDHYDTERLRKDGTIVEVSVSVSPIFGKSGEIVGAASIARDVSDRKRLEAMKDAFIANAAHELRTPLTTLSALATALVTRWRDLPEQRRDELFQAMLRQGERARMLISNLLELSQLEVGRLKVECRPVDLATAVADAIEGNAAPDGKRVEQRIPPGVPVFADPVRLQQVVSNLLTNAYRYGGGNICIEAEIDQDAVLTSVSDDGAGVPADLLPTLFEPFSRGQDSGKMQGSGLGLAICRALVEAFGGQMWYEPNQPSGARFRLRLRAAT